VIRATQSVSATHIDLAFANVEPAPPSVAPFMGGSNAYPRRVVLTPEQIAATNAEARTALRNWRLQTAAGYFEDVRRKITAARLTVHGCSLAWDSSFTDAEIEATFRQASLLGVGTISSPLTMTTAERLVPFAEKHRIAVAIHNQGDGNPRGDIDTLQLARALAMSPMFRAKLDIANLTASNRDAVAELRTLRSRLASVVLRDRLRNGGASQPFGEGDTPIREVLGVLADSEAPVPALVEYDYVGLRTAVDEVKASLAYVREGRQPER
jgi:sugar phosphate isomerase/epimerase